MNRKTLMIISGFLFLFQAYLYCIDIKYISDNKVIPIDLMFHPDITNYSTMVDYTVFSVRIMTQPEPWSRIYINGKITTVPVNGPYYLKYGKNSFIIEVRNSVNKSSKTYHIVIHRYPIKPVPVIFIDADKKIPDEPKIPAKMYCFTNYQWGTGMPYLKSACQSFNIKIELRGKSSVTNDQNQAVPKGQFAIDVCGQNGKEKIVSILGLPEDSDWVLNGPYSDKSLLRNFLAYELAREMGMYAPRTVFVELYLNQNTSLVSTNDYFGLFVLTERIKPSPDKVHIAVVKSDKFPVGYIFKKDKPDPEIVTFTTLSKIAWEIEYPKKKKLIASTILSLSNYVSKFEESLISMKFGGTECYTNYIDTDSFIDYMILNIAARNADAFIFSTYFYKDVNGKIKAGPPWDFNIAFGNINYYDCYYSSGWWVPYRYLPSKLLKDPSFVKKLIARWYELRQNVLSDWNVEFIIDQITIRIDEAQKRNFQKWPVLGVYLWPNPQPLPKTYEEEVSKLKCWLLKRLKWVDQNIKGIANLPPEKWSK
ncbi:MAG: hypothetical protein HPY53_02060 [Brevinematales bacterium]|nr:hypothetical protein [Brevinematales bacterium]